MRLLSTQVNERLKQAVESDSLLAGIYKDLSNGAVVSSSEEGADSQVMIGDGADASSDAGEGMQMKQRCRRDFSRRSQEHRQKRRSPQESLLTQLLRSSKSIQIIDIFA